MNMKRLAGVFTLFLCGAAYAQFGGAAGGLPLQFNLFDQSSGQNGSGTPLPGFSDTTGRTLRSTALVNGETTLIVSVIGDSISANSGPSAYTVTQTKNDNFNPYNGSVYDYADPVLGASTGPGSMWGILGDRLRSTARYQRVITINPSIGGTTSLDWSKGGAFGHRARVSCLYARSLGWPVTGSGNGGNWKMAWLYMLGTNDNAVGTSGANFTTRAQSTFQHLADYGCTAKILVGKITMLSNSVNATLQSSQAGLVNSVTTFTGPDIDSLTGGTNRVGDGTHLTLTGETNAIVLVDTALSNAGL
jgi:hypothetical protein